MALQILMMAVTPFRQNCTLVWDDESSEAVLIDVGGDAEWVLQQVAERGLTVKETWLTHGHLDHAGGVVDLRSRVDIPVIGPHRDDDYLLASLPEITAQYGFPVSPAFEPDRWLQEGDALAVGRYRFEVLHVFGHTPGHVVFYCAEAALLIAGDTLFHESIGRTDFPRGNHGHLLDNIRRKLYTLPEQTSVIPGHGRTTTIGHEKRHNPFVQA